MGILYQLHRLKLEVLTTMSRGQHKKKHLVLEIED